jgi:hypothetical protein
VGEEGADLDCDAIGDREDLAYREALGSTAGGSIGHAACPKDIRAPDGIQLTAETDDSRGVHDHVAAAGVVLPGPRLGNVASDDAIGCIRPQVNAADLHALFAVAVGEGAADEAKRAGDEDFRGHSGTRVRGQRGGRD